MAIFFIERAILIFANVIIEPFFSRIEQKNALSGYFYKRHPVDYKIFIFLGQPLNTDPELALYGRYCISKRLKEDGFEFKYPNIDMALQNIYSNQ